MSATTGVPTSTTTPETVQSNRLGRLEFRDGGAVGEEGCAVVRQPLGARRGGVSPRDPGRVAHRVASRLPVGGRARKQDSQTNFFYLDGGRNHRLTLPADIPESRFWSVTRSMLQTDQHLPRLGSQSGTVETNPDGSTDLYFGPTAPAGKTDNWLQTVPGKGWWPILRPYSPLQPFFDKTWRPSEIEPHT